MFNMNVSQQKLPLTGHLVELRKRLLWVFVVMALGTGLCFLFVENIYGFLVQPLANAMEGESLSLIHISEPTRPY